MRPWNTPDGTSVKLLLSRKISSRDVRFAKEGIEPDREFCCKERLLRRESEERSEGRVPERDMEARSMAVTCEEESQLTPLHLQ